MVLDELLSPRVERGQPTKIPKRLVFGFKKEFGVGISKAVPSEF
jgi:hypothetical protein